MADTSEREGWFLRPEREQDVLQFRPAPRTGSLKPYIDAGEAFPAMEQAIARAEQTVCMAMWVFNPHTRLLSASRGTWCSLLTQAAARGVLIRVLLSDFDPILMEGLHRKAWSTYKLLWLAAERLGHSKRGNLQVVISRHDARLEKLAGFLGLEARLLVIRDRWNGQVRRGGSAEEILGTAPGLWPYLRFNDKSRAFEVVPETKRTALTGVHHQKLLIVDERLGFCGGLDVDKGRLDALGHRREGAWHDIQCSFTGDAVSDLARGFRARWREESLAFHDFVRASNLLNRGVRLSRPEGGSPEAQAATGEPGIPRVPAPRRPHDATLIQVQRTVSRDSYGAVPRTVVRDILDQYQLAIGRANQYIYLENQYLRFEPIADWCASQARKRQGLAVIVVLPVAPEEFRARDVDPITLLGVFLQRKTIRKLSDALGTRLGVYSLLKNVRSEKTPPTGMFGSSQVYVHSKLMIIDDVWAHIGSCNANGRSFLVDTEAGVAWSDKLEIKRFRLRLWTELLGARRGLTDWSPQQFVTEWNRAADENARAPAGRRTGLVVRHDPDHVRGENSIGIPDEFASLMDFDAQPPGDTALA